MTSLVQSVQAKNTNSFKDNVNNKNIIKVAMGSSLKPMHYVNDAGELVGFEVDLVTQFAKSLGKKIEIIDPYKENSSSLTLLLSNKVDMSVNSLNITEQRKKWVAFSQPYFTSRTGLIVNAKAKNGFDNSNATIINLTNSIRYNVTNHNRNAYYNSYNNKIYLDSLETIYSTIENEKYPDFSGYVFAYDWMALKQLDPEKFKVVNIAIGSHDYGAAFRKNDQKYLSLWNSFITHIKNSGEYQTIFDKWFTDEPLPPVVNLDPYQNYKRCTGLVGLRMQDSNSKQHTGEWVYTGKEWRLNDNLLAQFKSSAIPFLPLLNCNVAPVANSTSKGFRLASPLINQYYKPEYGPYINELYTKIHHTTDKAEIKKLYEELMLSKGIVEMLPRYFPKSDDDVIYNRFFISAFYLLHEKHREIINNLYIESKKNNNQKLRFNFSSLSTELSMPTMIFHILEKGKNITTNIRLTEQYFYKNPDFNIEVIKPDLNGKPILKINGITGKFQSLKATGGNSIYRIHNLHKGVKQSFHAIGPIHKFDNHNIIMRNDGYEFYYDTNKGLVTKITKIEYKHDFHGEMLDETNVLLTKKWLDGLKNFSYYKLDDGSVYVLAHDYKKKNSSGNYMNKIYYKKPTDVDLKIVGESEGSYTPRYRYIIDEKLFLSSIGYDDAYRPQVININTSKTDIIENGVYAAAMVPIGEHKILYCSTKSNFLINTLTLEKEKISLKNIPCPGKTGAYIHYPKDNYFIYHYWELL